MIAVEKYTGIRESERPNMTVRHRVNTVKTVRCNGAMLSIQTLTTIRYLSTKSTSENNGPLSTNYDGCVK